MNKIIKTGIHISQRTHQRIIFTKEEEGGLGLDMVCKYIDSLYIIHTIRQLNSENDSYRELAEELFISAFNNQNSESDEEIYNIKNKWIKIIKIANSNQVKFFKDNNTWIIRNLINNSKYNLQKGNIDDVKAFKKHINEMWDNKYQRPITDDWIGKYIKEAWPDSIKLNNSNLTFFQTSTLLSSRCGSIIEDSKYIHPSKCKICNSQESIEHTFWECNPLQKLYLYEKIQEINKRIKRKILIVWMIN